MVNLTLDTLDALPGRCRSCVFWELSPLCAESAGESGDPTLEKEAWLSQTLLEWGGCGRIAYCGDRVAGFVTYASPKFVPRSMEFPSGPVSPDAALLMTVYVRPSYSNTGLGRQLIQTAAADLRRRGIHAIETFGDTRGEAEACLAPADFFRSIGFKTVRSDPRYPRLRLEMRSTAGRDEEETVELELPEPAEWIELADSELEEFLDRPGLDRPASGGPALDDPGIIRPRPWPDPVRRRF